MFKLMYFSSDATEFPSLLLLTNLTGTNVHIKCMVQESESIVVFCYFSSLAKRLPLTILGALPQPPPHLFAWFTIRNRILICPTLKVFSNCLNLSMIFSLIYRWKSTIQIIFVSRITIRPSPSWLLFCCFHWVLCFYLAQVSGKAQVRSKNLSYCLMQIIIN